MSYSAAHSAETRNQHGFDRFENLNVAWEYNTKCLEHINLEALAKGGLGMTDLDIQRSLLLVAFACRFEEFARQFDQHSVGLQNMIQQRGGECVSGAAVGISKR